MILPSWFDDPEENSAYKEVQVKKACLPVKTSCPPAKKVNETHGNESEFWKHKSIFLTFQLELQVCNIIIAAYILQPANISAMIDAGTFCK